VEVSASMKVQRLYDSGTVGSPEGRLAFFGDSEKPETIRLQLDLGSRTILVEVNAAEFVLASNAFRERIR